MRSAILVALGREQPLMNFIVKAEPPSVYIVWRVRADRVADLPEALSLPPADEADMLSGVFAGTCGGEDHA